MCGIVYSKSFTGKPVNKTITKRFQAQKHRGTNGFGFYIPETNQLLHNTKQGRTLALVRRTKATEMLFHHRLPTSTVNIRNACHPFSTKDFFEHNYVVVHNGVLHNEDTLAIDHYKQGIEYVSMQDDGSFNDSEALAYDIGFFMEGKQKTVKAAGSIAFIAVKRHKNGNAISLIYGRNSGNPLVKKETKHSMTLSSEGEGEDIKPNTIYEYNYETGKTTERHAYIRTSEYSSNKQYGDYLGYNGGYGWSKGYSDEDVEILNRLEVRDIYDSFMEDYNLDAWEAFTAADAMLGELKREEQDLWVRAWDINNGMNKHLNDEYDKAKHEMDIMVKAVSMLRGEAFGRQTEMGFQPHRAPRKAINATAQGGVK